MHFDEEDVEYLRSLHLFSEEFLEYLSGYRFHGDIDAFPEGTIMYPYEPILTVSAPLIDAQLVETAILSSDCDEDAADRAGSSWQSGIRFRRAAGAQH